MDDLSKYLEEFAQSVEDFNEHVELKTAYTFTLSNTEAWQLPILVPIIREIEEWFSSNHYFDVYRGEQVIAINFMGFGGLWQAPTWSIADEQVAMLFLLTFGDDFTMTQGVKFWS